MTGCNIVTISQNTSRITAKGCYLTMLGSHAVTFLKPFNFVNPTCSHQIVHRHSVKTTTKPQHFTV